MFGEESKNRLILILALVFILIDYTFSLGVVVFLGDFLVVFLVIGIITGIIFRSKKS